MNKFKIAVCVALIGFASIAHGASYDVKEETVTPVVLVADLATISSDKVMDGVTDVTLTLKDSKADITQRVVIQCDINQETITAFYYLNDTLGSKAKGANGFLITVYGNPGIGYKPGGEVTVFDSNKEKDNLRTGINRLSKLNGNGFISFEFYESKGNINKNPVAYTMLLSSGYLSKIQAAMDQHPDVKGCSLNGGFTSVYPLKNLTDSI